MWNVSKHYCITFFSFRWGWAVKFIQTAFNCMMIRQHRWSNRSHQALTYKLPINLSAAILCLAKLQLNKKQLNSSKFITFVNSIPGFQNKFFRCHLTHFLQSCLMVLSQAFNWKPTFGTNTIIKKKTTQFTKVLLSIVTWSCLYFACVFSFSATLCLKIVPLLSYLYLTDGSDWLIFVTR